MSDLVPYITKRFMQSVPEDASPETLSFRADVGYLLSLLASERHALQLIHSIAAGRIDFMSNETESRSAWRR